MSWQALRYRAPEVIDIGTVRKEGDPRKMTKHHAPPVRPDRSPRIIKVDERHHRAYHLLFGACASYEDACYILRRDWWNNTA